MVKEIVEGVNIFKLKSVYYKLEECLFMALLNLFVGLSVFATMTHGSYINYNFVFKILFTNFN